VLSSRRGVIGVGLGQEWLGHPHCLADRRIVLVDHELVTMGSHSHEVVSTVCLFLKFADVVCALVLPFAPVGASFAKGCADKDHTLVSEY